tara:strand:+ start:1221 stop:1745 length:525 start_codon:yes stop_codon:yes gene_type:complete
MLYRLPAALQLSTLQDPAAISTLADIAMILVGVAILVLSVVLVLLALRVNATLKSLIQNLGPASDRARSILDNVEFITQALRTDVERLNTSVKALNDRLHQASGHMEQRIEEFNALMEVIQGEAEGAFIKTAAAVKGVREGAQKLSRAARMKTRRTETRDQEAEAKDSDFESPQ